VKWVVVLACAGCIDKLGPEVGPLRVDASSETGGCDADGDPAHTVSFSADIVGNVFAHNGCTSCHTPGGDNPIGLQMSGLDLSSYSTLRTGGGRSGAQIVIDGMPCESILYQKLGPAPPFGERMPRGKPPLGAADLALVHDWIAEGAHDN
jgi:hypothetical protein